MILLSYVRRLAQQQGVFWLVPDSEAAVGALRTYQEGGHCGDGIHHLIVEMAYTTSTPLSWEASASPRPRPSTW